MKSVKEEAIRIGDISTFGMKKTKKIIESAQDERFVM